MTTQTQTPPQTTVTSSPSPPDWLTRLRTSKGFQDDSTYTDLEHFLSTSLPQSPPPPIPPHADVTSPLHIEPLPQHDVITNVLSDLFCFGNNQTSKPKTSRKQTNPKPCVSAKNSVLSSVRTSRKQSRPELCVSAKKSVVSVRENVEVEEEWEEDFRGFTETEVTVIDTSVASWKFDKVLYRRNNVWRVGDVNVNKKRKDGGGDGENMNKKKKKLKLCGEWKARDKENGEKMKKKKKKKLKFVQGHDQGKAMTATSEKKQDNCSQVQEKRVLKKQIDGGSSVILIKSIPITNKKDMSGTSKSCVKLQK